MSFKFENGIAFHEVTVRADHHDRDWDRSPYFTRPRSPGERQSSYNHRQRPKKWRKTRTLMEMTLDVVVNNIHTTNVETIASLPLLHIWRIYHECATNRMLSLHLWKIFSKLLLVDKDNNPDPSTTGQLYSYRATICRPSYELSYYTRRLACAGTVDFLACLTIVGVETFRLDELLALARLGNLLALTLDYGYRGLQSNGVTDNLTKGWSETDKAFPRLQTLHLTGPEITFRSLKYISRLPSLSVYGIWHSRSNLWAEIRRNGKGFAEEYGWTVVDPLDSAPSRLGAEPRSAATTPETPTVDLIMQTPELLVRDIDGLVEFRRTSTKPSSRSSQLSEKPRPSRDERSRTNLQPRKKRKIQDVLSSFES